MCNMTILCFDFFFGFKNLVKFGVRRQRRAKEAGHAGIYPQYCTISCSDNVLNKIYIISAAAGLWGINVSDKYFLVRGRVIFGDAFLFIPNIAKFHVLIMS